jgi:tetratricopeptide (TPR) repeat protein
MKLLRGRRHARWLSNADDAIQRGELDGAIELIQTVLESDEDNADALHLLGRIHFFREEFDAADALYTRLRAMDPTDEVALENLRQAHIRRGFQARELGDLAETERFFLAAIDLDPEDAFVHYNLGCAYADHHEDRGADAFRMWERAVELQPGYTDAHFDLAQVYFHNERYDDAYPHYEALVDARPDWPAPHYCMAVIRLKRGDTEGALKGLRDAIIVNTGWARTAAADEHLAPLRGNPEFEEIVDTEAIIPSKDLGKKVLTREDLLRDIEEFGLALEGRNDDEE